MVHGSMKYCWLRDDDVQNYIGWSELEFNCMFSQAGGVSDLIASQARCCAVMEKTHVGPTGARIYVSQPQYRRSPAQHSLLGIYVMVKTVVVLRGFRWE